MDFYSSMTSWSLFVAVVGAGLWYYRPEAQQPRRPSIREDKGKKSKQDSEPRGRTVRRLTSEDNLNTGAQKLPAQTEAAPKKRKGPQPKAAPAAQPAAAPEVVVEDEKESEAERQWAQRMAKTQQGTTLSATSKKENRVKTVKQSSAINTPDASAQQSPQLTSEAEDGAPVNTPMLNAGDVSDMLEPVAAGPTTLRITPSTQPQKVKAPKKSKEDVVETKKQRQHRKKNEALREQREANEKERKALEEKQRRTAREARGEPARNGIPVSKPPTSSAWQKGATAKPPSDTTITGQAAHTEPPLLDTFDNESTASSLAPSTTATSTDDGENGGMSYEDQLAQATRNSEDDGWTDVAPAKKSKKRIDGPTTVPEPVLSNKTNGQKTAPAVNGKPKGYQALFVEEPKNADASDPAAWEA